MSKERHSTKIKILETARKLALDKGFEDLTVRDICNNAEISIGAFYHHFSSKEELINESFLMYDYDLDTRLDLYNQGNPLSSLKSILLDQISFVTSFPHKLISEYYRAILSSPSKSAVNESRTYYKAVNHFVKLAIESKQFSSRYSKEYLTNYFIKHIRGNLIHWCLNPNNIDIYNQTSEELDDLFAMFSSKK
jgi:AcrR family transcriptional regulator